MTYAESYEKLQQARRDGVAEIRIEVNEGEFTVTVDEALEAFDNLAPGEWFEVVDAGRAARPQCSWPSGEHKGPVGECERCGR